MTVLQLDSASDVTPANMKKLQSLISTKNTVLLNHATWCGHCNIFKPEWEKLKTTVGKNINLVQIESDALTKLQQDKKTYKRLTPKDGMVYFPMIIIFIKKDGKVSEKKIYDGNRSATDLKEFLDETVKPSVKSKKPIKPKATKPKATKPVKTTKSKKVQEADEPTEPRVPLTLQKLNDELNNILNQLNKL